MNDMKISADKCSVLIITGYYTFDQTPKFKI